MARDDTASVLGALVIGGMVGAALGILFAPAKGEDTRKALKKEAIRVGKDLERGTREFVNEKVNPAIEHAKEKAGVAKDNVDKFVDVKKKELGAKLSE